MLKWCPCMGWCSMDSGAGGEAKVLLNPMTTPSYNVRRISSFGQTVINDAGEEEEIARHGSLPINLRNGSSNWIANPIPVQPGVTKADIATRMHRMASIPETFSPKSKTHLNKCLSETDKIKNDSSPLRTRKKIHTPEEFAQTNLQHDNASKRGSVVSETYSEGRSKDEEKVCDSPDSSSLPSLEVSNEVKQTEKMIEPKSNTSKSSLFQLVKNVKLSTSDKPSKSPWMKKKNASDKPNSPLPKAKETTTHKEPNPAAESSPILTKKSPSLTPRHSVDAPEIIIDTPSTPDINEYDNKSEISTTFEHKEISVETHEIDKPAKIDNETDYKTEDKAIADDEEYDEDGEENISQSLSQTTTHFDEDMDEVILDGTKEMDSIEIAKQYGLDLSLYDMNTVGLSSGNQDDDLSADTSIAKIHFTAHLDKEKHQLLISVERVEGLAGQGAKNNEFDVVVKLGFLKGGHSYSTKPIQSSKSISQNFSLNVKDLATSILRFSVYNSSWQGSHDALGHALFRVSKCTQSTTHHALNISPKSNITDSVGLLEVSFRFQAKVLYIVVHKVFDILPTFRNCKLYTKVAYFISSKKFKEKISKTENADKGFVMFDFESKFNADKLTEQHTYVMISLKKKGENNKLFKNDKTLGRLFLGPLFYTGKKINFWGQAILEEKIITHTFSLYL